MKSLDELKKQQPQILLAELGGLLHNIGKLEPNFFQPPKQELASQHCFISSYRFDRFAKPEIELTDKAREIICDQISRWNPEDDKSRQDFENELKMHGKWESGDSPDYQQRALDAAWMLVRFLKSNGPLFFSRQSERAEKHAEMTRLRKERQEQFDNLKNQLGAGTPEERKELGPKIGELQKDIAEIARQLNEPILLPKETTEQTALENNFRSTKIEIVGQYWQVAELLTFFWDDFFFKPDDDDYKRQTALHPWTESSFNSTLHALLILSHGEVSHSEKSGNLVAPLFSSIKHATVFGCESVSPSFWDYPALRRQIIEAALIACANVSTKREQLITSCQSILQKGLGDSRWPVNEINLWDYAGSVATLFKSAVAKAVLEDRLPTVGEVKWRLLSIRYDGLEYLSSAHHISDLLARRETLEAALNAVKTVIEVEYPMGNEIYRDENGSVLLVPDVRDGDQQLDLLKQECGEAGTLDDLLLTRFSEASYGEDEDQRSALGGEIKPVIALSDERLGKQINLTEAKGWLNPPLQADPQSVKNWWSDPKKRGEVCTVCGLRPQGFGAPDDRHSETNKKGWKLHLEENHHEHKNKQPLDCEVCKAIDRQVCWDCMERRDDRSKKWASNADGSLKRTIWTDEVADSNGRLALVVGRFVLDGWLDGILIPTMQKSASFARIQRCWRTTQEFWKDIERKLPELVGEEADRRLKVTPENLAAVKLGPSHVYDLELSNRHLSVVWTGNHFITADNLEYFSQTAGLGKEPDWKALLEEKSFSVYEPSAHLSRRQEKTQVTIKQVEHGERYSPFIPILAQPSLFMALVPANKAMDVAKHIKCKYEAEIGRVRDRLPLHLGLVFAPRRTPIRALLESGRRMLEIPDVWTRWEVESVSHSTQHHIAFRNNCVRWHIPAVMGDGTTPDQWYPHLMLREPASGEDLTNATPSPWKHAKDLQPGDKVYVRPSRFDYEFLDTTGRRFELNYDKAGVRVAPANRLHPSTRPFLLEEIADLEDVWEALKKLPSGQRDSLVRLIETKRTEWRVTKSDLSDKAYQTLQRFARDTLRQISDGWWKNLDGEQRRLLKEWAANGRLANTLELYEEMMKLEIQEGERA